MLCYCRCGQFAPEGRHYIPGHWLDRVKLTVPERFWSFVQIGAPEECWLWQGVTDRLGYGQFALRRRKTITAHRMAFQLEHGSIPAGKHIMHVCDVKACVNPRHLEAGTPQQNTRDAFNRGLSPVGDRHWTRRMPERLARGKREGDYIKGEAHHKAKLTEADVRYIRQAYPAEACKDLATRFGVTEGMIRHILKRRSWKHIK